MYLPDLKQPNAPAGPTGTGTILLVDDNDAFRSVISTFLQSSGYKVLEARSASEASIIAAHQEKPIDLLLTDVVLPGVNGDQLGDYLRFLFPQITVVFMSGYGTSANFGSVASPAHTCCRLLRRRRCCWRLPSFCTGKKTTKSSFRSAPGAMSRIRFTHPPDFAQGGNPASTPPILINQRTLLPRVASHTVGTCEQTRQIRSDRRGVGCLVGSDHSCAGPVTEHYRPQNVFGFGAYR